MSHEPVQTTLENGIRVVIQELPYVQSAVVHTGYGVGTLYETAEENGTAHFLEHMAFSGTLQSSKEEIQDRVEEIGANLGAFTAHRLTSYSASGYAGDAPEMIRILSEVATQPTLPESEIANEQSIILKEIGQMADDPDNVRYASIDKAVYGDTAAGRTILGPRDLVASMTRERLVSFRDSHYHGGNMVVSIAGNVEADRMIDILNQALADVAQGLRSDYEHPQFRPGFNAVVKPTEHVDVGIIYESASRSDPNHYAENILGYILGGHMGSRLFQEVREKRGLTYGVGSGNAPGEDDGTFRIGGSFDVGDLNEALDVIHSEILKTANDITDKEVERAKIAIRNDIVTTVESSKDFAQSNLTQIAVRGHIENPEINIEGHMSVTSDEVRAAAQRVFSGPPAVSVIGVEEGAKIAEAFHRRFNPT